MTEDIDIPFRWSLSGFGQRFFCAILKFIF
jgi:hypothetical protein